MLKTMRKNVKALKPVLWFVVGAFIVSIFVYWGASGKLSQENRMNALVTVGKEKISAEAYFNALRNRIEALKAQYQDINRSFVEQLNIPQQVLESLVEQALLFDLAKRMGIRASDEEVRDRVVALPGLQRDGVFVGYEEYKRALQYNRIPLAEFEDGLRREVVLSKTIQLMTAGLAADPEEVWNHYKAKTDSAKIETFILELSKVEIEGAPDEAALRAFFESRADAFRIPEKREASAVFLKTDDLKREIELTERDLEKYYADNASMFATPEAVRAGRIWLPYGDRDRAQVEAEARVVLDRLRTGEDFAGLAQAFSKDDRAAEGGDYGLYDWMSLPSKEQDEIRNLAAGTVSDLVGGDDGLAIVRVAEKTPAATTPLEEAKPRIRSILQDQKARDLASERILKLEKAAKKAGNLEETAASFNLKAESTGLLESGAAWGENDPSGAVATALFDLKEKELSAPIYSFAGVGLAELRTIEAPRAASFEEARTDVETAYADFQKKEKALAILKEFRAKLTDRNAEDLAARYALEYKTVDEHKREQYIGLIGENKEIDAQIFSLPPKEAGEPVAFDNGAAVVRVLDRKEGTKEEFETVKDSEAAEVLDEKRNKFLQAYLAKLRTDRGVKIEYQSFLDLTQDILSRFD